MSTTQAIRSIIDICKTSHAKPGNPIRLSVPADTPFRKEYVRRLSICQLLNIRILDQVGIRLISPGTRSSVSPTQAASSMMYRTTTLRTHQSRPIVWITSQWAQRHTQCLQIHLGGAMGKIWGIDRRQCGVHRKSITQILPIILSFCKYW